MHKGKGIKFLLHSIQNLESKVWQEVANMGIYHL